jgi:hypothetical protein
MYIIHGLGVTVVRKSSLISARVGETTIAQTTSVAMLTRSESGVRTCSRTSAR